jgi:hypothetical protein
VIQNTINMGQELVEAYMGDISDAELLVRPVPGMNHAAWQLGHLISSENMMISGMGYGMPQLPDGLAESHSREASTSDDGAKFATKEQYLKWMADQRAGTMAALASASDADLGKPSPESMQAYAKTVGAVFNIIGLHMMMHSCQWVALRRKLGKPIVI